MEGYANESDEDRVNPRIVWRVPPAKVENNQKGSQFSIESASSVKPVSGGDLPIPALTDPEDDVKEYGAE